jgi:hypothetical protein
MNAQISEKDFITPPMKARPSTYWMWMNGNITKEGLTKDLEHMKRTSMGGAIMFNTGVGIARGPVNYASPEWDELTLHACKEANRLGLELLLQNSPGYSGTGGPWITPENSMQELEWTEAIVTTNKKGWIEVQMPCPHAKMGYYRDAFVLAYPSLSCEQDLFADLVTKVTVNGKVIDKSIVLGGNTDTKIRMAESKNVMLFELSHPFEARSISILRDNEEPKDPYDGPRDYPPTLTLEYSNDGINFSKVCTFSCPALRAMDTPGIASFDVVKAAYYRLTTTNPTSICDVNLHSSPRLKDWTAKTNYVKNDVLFGENNQIIPPDLLIDPAKVIDVTSLMDANGKLRWKAPKGKWTIVRIGHTTTGEVVAAAPDSGVGLDCDKFSKAALDKHFELFLEPLLIKLKPYCGNTLVGLMMDSWEAGKQNWTVNLPEYFKKRRGYDVRPYLLAMTGRIVGSVDDTEHYLWDMRRTHTDMFNENFLDHFADFAHKHNLKFAAEPYGDGNFESLEYAEKTDIPMSEFWVRYIYGGVTTTKLAASTAHSFGKKIVGAESFTGTPFTSKFTEYPYAMKAEGDWMMTLGVNRLVYHTYAHQPYTGERGIMTMGPFGTHLNRNSTWAEQSVGWNTYNSRCCYMLQQGLPVVDLCFLKDEAISSGIPDYDIISPVVPYGYRWDIIGKSALLNRLSIENHRIVLPDGMIYRLFVLPDMKKMTPAVLSKLVELVKQGMPVLLNGKPDGCPGLNSQDDEEVKSLVKELWANLDGKANKEATLGKGKVFLGMTYDQVLNKLNIIPDFQFTAQNQDAQIHFVHRVVNDEDVYFVTNHRRRCERVVATFRISGKTPELWDAETGEIKPIFSYQEINGVTKVALDLQESGSAFVVFRNNNATSSNVVADFPAPKADKYREVKDNFTISFWGKPDCFAPNGKGFVFYPQQGELIYGEGHATVGLSLGQNGIKIAERSSKSARTVLTYDQPIEGWTFVTLNYNNGTPSLFVNGQLAVTGEKSVYTVHPSLKAPASEEQYISGFEGDNTEPLLHTTPLNEYEIISLYKENLPSTLFPDDFKILTTLNDSWKIEFPEWSKAPKEIVLPKLMSLHKSNDFNVKHFSGTATYSKIIKLSKKDLKAKKQFWLDLGRVENIAEITVNGQKTGLLWKAPFRINISKQLIPGENQLKVEVTNLWPNRMIGDEYLPDEFEYDQYGRIKQIPQWFLNQEVRKGDKVLFSTWKHYKKTEPLLESGLLGPVRILFKE